MYKNTNFDERLAMKAVFISKKELSDCILDGNVLTSLTLKWNVIALN